MDLSTLSTRELQLESARALSTIEATNNNIDQYGDLPSKVGPGKDVKLVYNV